MNIHLYDTQSRSKRIFVPSDPNRITLYACGPTVYNRAHIGNARPAVVFDLLARLLRFEYGEDKVIYARNITDIDDKIILAADKESVDIKEISDRYERHYVNDMAAIGVLPPTLSPRATEHISDIISMISQLIDRGVAYFAQDHVLFDITKDSDYGTLSNRSIEDMIAGFRVEAAPYKKSPGDFILWKPSTDSQPGWNSPWGRGRPGWHIECSAMIKSHLGETIDIHGGGQDLAFPHHENECAQSRCAHEKPLARYWMHNGFLSLNGDTMSKSKGNIITVSELLESGVDGAAIRSALLSSHYRQPLNWSADLVANETARIERLRRLLSDTNIELGDPLPEFLEALADDLNTPKSLAVISANAKRNPSAAKASLAILGIDISPLMQPAPSFLIDKINERNAARANKDWALSDQIRKDLFEQGYILEDGPNGTTWRTK